MHRAGIPSLNKAFPHIKGKCSNCKKPLPKYCRRWCSAACSSDAYIKTDSSAMRSAVHERDKGVCAHCGWDTDAFRKVLRRMEDYARGYIRNDPVTERDKVEFHRAANWLYETFHVSWYSSSSLWQGDHIIPLVEGGKHLLENMRTLCTFCHKIETKALAARRAKARREKCLGLI